MNVIVNKMLSFIFIPLLYIPKDNKKTVNNKININAYNN